MSETEPEPAEPALGASGAAAPSVPAVRSAEIMAALSLATDIGLGHRLESGLLVCRTATRLGEHLALAPAVEHFPPTQQFPELTGAQALLSTLNP